MPCPVPLKREMNNSNQIKQNQRQPMGEVKHLFSYFYVQNEVYRKTIIKKKLSKKVVFVTKENGVKILDSMMGCCEPKFVHDIVSILYPYWVLGSIKPR